MMEEPQGEEEREEENATPRPPPPTNRGAITFDYIRTKRLLSSIRDFQTEYAGSSKTLFERRRALTEDNPSPDLKVRIRSNSVWKAQQIAKMKEKFVDIRICMVSAFGTIPPQPPYSPDYQKFRCKFGEVLAQLDRLEPRRPLGPVVCSPGERRAARFQPSAHVIREAPEEEARGEQDPGGPSAE